MKFNRFASGMLFGFAVLTAQAEPVRVATLYSSFKGGKKSFLKEYDKHLKVLGWSVRKFENIDLAKLVATIPETDVVIGCSVYNYEHSQDFADIQAPFIAWLEEGGVALFTDASYGTSLDTGVCRWGERFALTMELASAHTKPSPETRIVRAVPDCGLAAIPNDLAILATEHNHWAHFKTFAPTWQPALVDSDNKPILVYQRVGKGLLAVTNLSCMDRFSGIALGPALLENLWTNASGIRAGVEIQQVELGPPLTGKHTCQVRLATRTDQETQVRVKLTAKAPDGKPTEAESTIQLVPGKAMFLSMPYDLPTRGKHDVELSFYHANEQRSFWSLQRTVDIPPWITLSTVDRWLYPDRKKAEVSVTLVPDPDVDLNNVELAVGIVRDGRILSQKIIQAPLPDQMLTVPLTGVPRGPAAIQAIIRHAGIERATTSLDIHLCPQPKVWIKQNRQCIVDGKPFFPMGMYFVCWTMAQDQLLAGLRDLAQRGFNAAHVGTKRKDWDFKIIADEAQKLGIKLIVEFGTPREETVAKWKHHPAILAWNPGDEPDGHGTLPAEMQARRETFKTLDPDRPSYLTLCVPDLYNKYAPFTDVLTIDPYPVKQKQANLGRVAECVDMAQEAMGRKRLLWVVPQAFGYEDKPGSWRVPTPVEERCMTYQALVHGARGLIYYTYFDRSFDLTKAPELREELTHLAAEVKILAPALMAPGDGQLLRLGKDEVIHVLIREYEGKKWVLAVNVSPETLTSVPIPVAAATQDVDVLFEDRRLPARNQIITDNFPGYGTHVYAVDTQ